MVRVHVSTGSALFLESVLEVIVVIVVPPDSVLEVVVVIVVPPEFVLEVIVFIVVPQG